jgi:hypothetical protein
MIYNIHMDLHKSALNWIYTHYLRDLMNQRSNDSDMHMDLHKSALNWIYTHYLRNVALHLFSYCCCVIIILSVVAD